LSFQVGNDVELDTNEIHELCDPETSY